MKKYKIFTFLFLLVLSTVALQAQIDSLKLKQGDIEIPKYTIDSLKPYFGIDQHFHYQFVKFEDNTTGKIFKNGKIEEYLILSNDMERAYYNTQESTVKALYIYNKHKVVMLKDRYYTAKDEKILKGTIPVTRYVVGSIEESKGLMWGTYSIQNISFEDGISGRVFRGGNSKRYFISTDGVDRIYYANYEAVVKALYIFKRYTGITEADKN